MKINELNSIEQIKMRICELQKAHVSLQEQFKAYQNNVDSNLNDSALKIIDILDMIETTKSNVDLDNEANSNTQLIIKKIEKRLIAILKYWQVQEIVFKDGQIEVGKAKVLETRKVPGEIPVNTIVEVCRKGYQRGNKTIRPADVVTAEKK
jgi:molecular chaperone GrpE (heat shock protein)